jgi:hypothetical protein
MRVRLRHALAPVLVLTPLLAACDLPGAYGDANSIVAIVDEGLWQEVEDSVYTVLEPTIWTVRDEKAFTVTHATADDQRWGDLRRFRQLLLIGPASEPHIAEALERRSRRAQGDAVLVQVNNVWARGQQVTILLTPEDQQAAAVRANLSELQALYDRQYRQWAISRMYVSGRDSTLADTLWEQAGFRLLPPEVYQWAARDSIYLFRNDNPDPSELIRQIMITWMSPAPEDMDAEGLLAWRKDVADAHYEDDQVVVLDTAVAESFEFMGRDAYQIQAVWQSPPTSSWPAAGPFILRAVLCPEQDRLYLLDAWLYAPGKEKYEYMIQLETILDSFRCETGASP